VRGGACAACCVPVVVPTPVVSLSFENGYPILTLEDGETITAKCLLIATGAQYRRLIAEGCEPFEGRGVYYAATAIEEAVRAKYNAAQVLVAQRGNDVSMLPFNQPALDLSEYEVAGLPYKPVRLFAYSGRNLYRPGESFELSVLARDPDGGAVPAQPIQALLKRPDGKTHLTATWPADVRRRRLPNSCRAQNGMRTGSSSPSVEPTWPSTTLPLRTRTMLCPVATSTRPESAPSPPAMPRL